MSGIETYFDACHPHVFPVFYEGLRHYESHLDILYLQGQGGQTIFVRKEGESFIAKHNLGYFEEQLPCCFARMHQRHIINFHHLFAETADGRLYLKTEKPHELWLGKTYIDEFYEKFDHWNKRHLPPPPPILPP